MPSALAISELEAGGELLIVLGRCITFVYGGGAGSYFLLADLLQSLVKATKWMPGCEGPKRLPACIPCPQSPGPPRGGGGNAA